MGEAGERAARQRRRAPQAIYRFGLPLTVAPPVSREIPKAEKSPI